MRHFYLLRNNGVSHLYFVKSNPYHDELGRFASASILAKMSIAQLRTLLKGVLSKYKGKGIVNKENGAVAMIAKTGIEKISSDKAIAKSIANGFTVAEHFEIAIKTPSLFKRAHFRGSKADERSINGDVEIERYLSPTVELSTGKRARAYITIKWTRSIKGRRIYSIETMNIKSVPRQAGARIDRTLSNNVNLNDTSIPPSTQKSTLTWADVAKIANASRRRSAILCAVHNGRLVKLRRIVYTVAGGA